MFESIKKMFGLGKFSKKNKCADTTRHDISKVITGQEGFIKDMSFDFVHKEFIRLMESGKINRALSLLTIMSKKAKTKEEFRKFTMHITSSVLNGVFWKKINTDIKDGFFNICRTLGCLIGLWIKDSQGQEKAQNLFNIFNKYVNKKDDNKNMTEQQKIEKFSARLSDLEDINAFSKNDLLSLEEKTLLTEYLALSYEDSVSLKSSVFSKGPELIEALEPADTKAFWAKVMKEIPKDKCNYDEVKFYVQTFISWFGKKMMEEMIDGIKNEKIIGKIHIAHEAEEAVNAFREFFVENLDDVEKILEKLEKASPALAA